MWKRKDEGERYFFCSDPGCDVVYFGDNDSIITKAQLRTTVGVKETSNDAPACYCFGVSKADAINDPTIREYVMSQTKHAQCSCDVSNPSGRCCLKDFPRAGKQLVHSQWGQADPYNWGSSGELVGHFVEFDRHMQAFIIPNC